MKNVKRVIKAKKAKKGNAKKGVLENRSGEEKSLFAKNFKASDAAQLLSMEGSPFRLAGDLQPQGDQPQAIEKLVENIKQGQRHQVLLGVTGSGKTFTMANTIFRIGRPALILAPNKTLAAQLFEEMRALFPLNSVEYFVSYYDFYQPEAYIPSTDTYIEKDSAINEYIDRMRHSATRSLFTREDVIIVASVSCIYGLGSPESYKSMSLRVTKGQGIARDALLKEFLRIQYQRNNVDFARGNFRVRGDVVEIFPAYEDMKALRFEFFGSYIEEIYEFDPLTGEVFSRLNDVTIFPASHYVTSDEFLKKAIVSIQNELRERLVQLASELKFTEKDRLEQRTYHDIEMIEEIGFCQGIENYSRHLSGRGAGEPPPTLIEYFPKGFITFIDESHITVPQIGAMYRGDRARKMNLVEFGFRLPSALDNRPLNFAEFESAVDYVVYVSATPQNYELEKSGGLVVEQIIRPTGLLDPLVEVRPVRFQVDDLLKEIRIRIGLKERVLITTLTKRSAEDLCEYYLSLGIKVKYLHSDIKTVERSEIIRDLRLGVYDVLVGINLLREGLDIPEVSLVGITDADKEGFLRSQRSLIQTIGRAARNQNGKVILYADKITPSMQFAMDETKRRRSLQEEHNRQHHIKPKTIYKRVAEGLGSLYQDEPRSDLLSMDRLASRASAVSLTNKELKGLTKEIEKKRAQMKKFAQKLEFEEAAKLRDEIKRLEILMQNSLAGDVDEVFLQVLSGESLSGESGGQE